MATKKTSKKNSLSSKKSTLEASEEAKRLAIKTLLKEGKAYREIQAALRVSALTISTCKKELAEEEATKKVLAKPIHADHALTDTAQGHVVDQGLVTERVTSRISEKLLATINSINADAISLAPLRDRVSAFKTLFEAHRLATGQSTSNVSQQHTVIRDALRSK